MKEPTDCEDKICGTDGFEPGVKYRWSDGWWEWRQRDSDEVMSARWGEPEKQLDGCG